MADNWRQRWCGTAAAAVLAVLVTLPIVAAADEAAVISVDLALIMAIDESASISGPVYRFELQGHAAALCDPAVVRAFTQGVHGRVALLAAGFSGPNSLRILVPWTVIGGAAEAAAFAANLLASPPDPGTGSTALGSAIERAVPLYRQSGFQADRQVLDLVSNGFSNAGPDPESRRDRASAAGITINALAILDEYDWLEAYYAESVITGPGAFVVAATGPGDFAAALRRKLVIEVSGLTGATTTGPLRPARRASDG